MDLWWLCCRAEREWVEGLLYQGRSCGTRPVVGRVARSVQIAELGFA